jgi:3-deoxy-D-manno-octulosonate 8-phosphate phosphatase (KDO 8-P phosphatase)
MPNSNNDACETAAAASPAATDAVMARAARTKLMIFDVDGVLTDGGLYYGADGETIKRFNVMDGLGIKFLQQYGIVTAIISARQSPIVARRAADLGIAHVYQGSHNKDQALQNLLHITGQTLDSCGFLGDDVVDLPILTQVGFAASVANGHPEVTRRVHYVTRAAGGHGAAREICDLLLRAQGYYEAAMTTVAAMRGPVSGSDAR